MNEQRFNPENIMKRIWRLMRKCFGGTGITLVRPAATVESGGVAKRKQRGGAPGSTLEHRLRALGLRGICPVLRRVLPALMAIGCLFLAGIPEAVASVTVSGYIVYTNVDESNEAALDATYTTTMYSSIFHRGLTNGAPVQYVTVELWAHPWYAPTGVQVGSDVTRSNGYFEIETESSFLGLETPGVLHVEARNKYVNVKESKLIPEPTDNSIKAEFVINDSYKGGDVELGELGIDDHLDTFTVWNTIGTGNTYPVSRAMFVASSVYRAARHIEELTGASLDEVWVRLGWLGTAWYDSQWYDPLQAWLGAQLFDIVTTINGLTTHKTIHLPGDEAVVIDHEYGHFIEDSIGALGVIPDYFFTSLSDHSHSLCEEQPGVCWAFSEGLASFYAAVNSRGFTDVSGVTFYGDPLDLNTNGDAWDEQEEVIENALGYSWWIEMMTNECDLSQRAGWTDPTAVEGVVAQVLWDLVDSNVDSDDPLTNGVPEVAEIPIQDVLEVLMADTSYKNPCGGLEVYKHPISLEQFSEVYLAHHPEQLVHPDLYAAFAFNGLSDFGPVDDNTGPNAVWFSNSSHAEGVWTNQADLELTVTDGLDDFSGSYYYWYSWDTDSDTTIHEALAEIGKEDFQSKSNINAISLTLPEGDNQYIHVQTRDLARHLGTTAHLGPLRVDLTKPYWIPSNRTFEIEDRYLIGTYVHFEWEAGDDLSGVDYVLITYNDPDNDIDGALWAKIHSAAGAYDLYLDPDYVVPTTAGYFSLTVVDRAGNGLTRNTSRTTIVSPFDGPNDLGLALEGGRVVCGDLDGDGTDEIVISGADGGVGSLRVINLSKGTAVTNLSKGMQGGDLFLADLDRNGTLDLLAAGDFGGAAPEVYLFSNDGGGHLSSAMNIPIPDTFDDMVVRVVDLYGTGEPVMVYGGKRGGGTPHPELLAVSDLLSGAPVVSLLTGTYFRGGDFEVGDINADGYFDFVTLGVDGSGSGSVRVYLRESQEGKFSWTEAQTISDVYYQVGDVDLGNWDLDNDLELFAMYRVATPLGTEEDYSAVWEWTGHHFDLAIEANNAHRIAEGDGHIVEIYNDGMADVFAMGRKESGMLASWYVSNEALGQRGSGVPYPARVSRLYHTDTAWGDFDNDGDLDVVITGRSVAGSGQTVWYENKVNGYGRANRIPPPPKNLQREYDPVRGGYVLSWEAPDAHTDETAETAFEYEIRVGAFGTSDVVTWAHPAGHGQQVAPQSVDTHFERFVPMPSPDPIDWCVRTVDNGWRRSVCASEISPAAFSSWQARYYSAEEIAAGKADATADSDGDGRATLLEYYLGSNPVLRDTNPDITVERGNAGTSLIISWTRSIAAEVNAKLQMCPAVESGGWFEVPGGVVTVTEAAHPTDPSLANVRAEVDLGALAAATTQFFRLQVFATP